MVFSCIVSECATYVVCVCVCVKGWDGQIGVCMRSGLLCMILFDTFHPVFRLPTTSYGSLNVLFWRKLFFLICLSKLHAESTVPSMVVMFGLVFFTFFSPFYWSTFFFPSATFDASPKRFVLLFRF